MKFHTKIKSLILCSMYLSLKKSNLNYLHRAIYTLYTHINYWLHVQTIRISWDYFYWAVSLHGTWIYNVILREDTVTCQCKSDTLTNGLCQREVACLASLWQSQQNTLHYTEIYPPINHINIGWRATLRFNPTVNQKSNYHTSPGNEVDTVWQYKALSYIRQFKLK